MSPGQLLYHGGVLKVDCSADSVILVEPLSTTFNPCIAVNEAIDNGKAFDSEKFHINLIKVINSSVKVYPFKPNLSMSHEAEVLLEAGVKLKKIKDTIIDRNYKVFKLFPGKTCSDEKIVEAHIIEWEIV